MLETIWRNFEDTESRDAFQRVDAVHPFDLFAAIDGCGRRGLIFMSRTRPPEFPPLANLDVAVSRQPSGIFMTCLWLEKPELNGLFSALCEDIVESSRNDVIDDIGRFIADRLLRWQRLLTLGGDGLLSLPEVRGLVGELLVLRTEMDHYGVPEAVEAWVGPLRAAKDFAFHDRFIEVKAVGPSANFVRISTLEQLEVGPAPLFLSVVTLAPVAAEASVGKSVAQYIEDVEAATQHYPVAMAELKSRIAAVGYAANEAYGKIRLRLDGIRMFHVCDTFPRINRAQISAGIAQVSYDIHLSALSSYEQPYDYRY